MASIIGRPLGLVLADAASTAAPHIAGLTAAAYFSHHIALARSAHSGFSGRVAWAAEPSWARGDALLGARPSGTSLQTVPDYPRGITYAKHYPVAPLQLHTVWAPMRLFITAIKQCGLTFSFFVMRYMMQVERAEAEAYDRGEEPQLPGFPTEELKPLTVRMAAGVIRDIALQTTRRIMEMLVVQKLSPRTAWKLQKDIRSSARRKRYLPWHQRILRVTRTHFRSMLLTYLADFLVTTGIDTVRIYRRREFKNVAQGILKRAVANAARVVVGLAASSIGAGIGCFIMPRAGVVIFSLAADTLVWVYFAGPILDRWADAPPPAGLAPAAPLADDAAPQAPADPHQHEALQSD